MPDHRFIRTNAARGLEVTPALVRAFELKEAGLAPPIPKPPALTPMKLKLPSLEMPATPQLKALHTAAEGSAVTQARNAGPARADLSASRGASAVGP